MRQQGVTDGESQVRGAGTVSLWAQAAMDQLSQSHSPGEDLGLCGGCIYFCKYAGGGNVKPFGYVGKKRHKILKRTGAA